METFSFKVLIAGPFGVGKTTLIQQISGVPVVGTEVATTGTESLVKATTTVGIEYGVFSLAEGDLHVELLLFGTPGQTRFSAVREIAARGMDGLLVLVDGTDESTWDDAAELYESFGGGGVPTLVVVNRWPDGEEPPAGLLERLGVAPEVPVSHGDVVDPDDARRFLVEVLSLVLDATGEFDEDDLDAGDDGTDHHTLPGDATGAALRERERV